MNETTYLRQDPPPWIRVSDGSKANRSGVAGGEWNESEDRQRKAIAHAIAERERTKHTRQKLKARHRGGAVPVVR